MANIGSDPNDALPQPVSLDANSTPKERKAANDAHRQTLAGHLLDNSMKVGHGHAVGRQGPKGHAMPPSDAHMRKGASIPQNRQSTYSDGAGSANANDPSTSEYAVVDNKND